MSQSYASQSQGYAGASNQGYQDANPSLYAEDPEDIDE